MTGVKMTRRHEIDKLPCLSDAFEWLSSHIIFSPHSNTSDRGYFLNNIFLHMIRDGLLKKVRGKYKDREHYEPIGPTKLPKDNVFFDIVCDRVIVYPRDNNIDVDMCGYNPKVFDIGYEDKYVRYRDVRVDMEELKSIRNLPEYAYSIGCIEAKHKIPISKKSLRPQQCAASKTNREYMITKQTIIDIYKELYESGEIKTGTPIKDIINVIYLLVAKENKTISRNSIKKSLETYKPSRSILNIDD